MASYVVSFLVQTARKSLKLSCIIIQAFFNNRYIHNVIHVERPNLTSSDISKRKIQDKESNLEKKFKIF